MAELEISGIALSNYVRSVRMLCEEKGVAYKLNPARPQTPEVATIHPAGQVPCMPPRRPDALREPSDRHLHRQGVSGTELHPPGCCWSRPRRAVDVLRQCQSGPVDHARICGAKRVLRQ